MEHGEQIWKRLSAWRWRLLLVYLCLLAVSFVVRSRQPREVAAPNVQLRTVPAIQREQPTQRSVRVAYGEFLPESNPSAPVVVLLHGSPGNHRDFQKFAPALAKHYRVIVPDLPGFGSSSHSIPDYSTRAHARYVLELLDQLHIERAHFIGFSMGGGVVLNIADIAPQRVQSIVMLSAIGVQELELLGNYHINHSLHGLQLGFLQLLLEGVPHMGWLDRSMLDVSYARNFYDTDQRPLRAILAKYEGPMLIVHGERDILVPVEAAREHYRLVPQSELRIFDSARDGTNRSRSVYTSRPRHADQRRPYLHLGRCDGSPGQNQFRLRSHCVSGGHLYRRPSALSRGTSSRPRGFAACAIEVVCA